MVIFAVPDGKVAPDDAEHLTAALPELSDDILRLPAPDVLEGLLKMAICTSKKTKSGSSEYAENDDIMGAQWIIMQDLHARHALNNAVTNHTIKNP